MRPRGIIVHDSEVAPLTPQDVGRPDLRLMPVRCSRWQAARLGEVMRNSVALGVAIALSRYDFTLLEKVLTEQFQDKGAKVVAENVASARAGYDHVLEHLPKEHIHGLEGHLCGMPGGS